MKSLIWKFELVGQQCSEYFLSFFLSFFQCLTDIWLSHTVDINVKLTGLFDAYRKLWQHIFDCINCIAFMSVVNNVYVVFPAPTHHFQNDWSSACHQSPLKPVNNQLYGSNWSLAAHWSRGTSKTCKAISLCTDLCVLLGVSVWTLSDQ